MIRNLTPFFRTIELPSIPPVNPDSSTSDSPAASRPSKGTVSTAKSPDVGSTGVNVVKFVPPVDMNNDCPVALKSKSEGFSRGGPPSLVTERS